jgi:hypothetical protein
MSTLPGQRAQFTWALNQYNQAEDSEARTKYARRMATEHAKDLPDGQKIDVETKAGALASWIAENKRKFA